MQVAVLSLLPTEMQYHQRTLPGGDGVRVLALSDATKEEVVAIKLYSAKDRDQKSDVKGQEIEVRGQKSGGW